MNYLAVAVLLFPVLRAQPAFLQNLELLRSMDLRGTTYHVQGIDTDGRHMWVTSVDSKNRKGYLHEFSFSSGVEEATREIQDDVRFHPGGIALDGGSIWIPVAEYRPASTSLIEKRNKRTLKLDFAFKASDHIACIAVTSQYLIGANWDAKEFYVWDHSGRLVRKAPNETQNAYQDMKVDRGYLIASGLLADHTGAIDWLELPSFHLHHRVLAGNTDRQIPLTQEGMAVWEKELVLLPEDGPSRLFVFKLPGTPGGNNR